jgi:hypothetical protein
MYGVGNDALALLKKQYINFGNATIHSLILHLREKTAIGVGSSGTQRQASWSTSPALTSFKPPLLTRALQQASRR